MSTIYQKIFAAVYDPVMNAVEKKIFYKNRSKLIGDLEGKILEVGVGTGVNFKFYHPNAEVIAVEPSLPMLQRAEKKITAGQNIQILNHGINAAEVEKVIAPGSLDAAVCTLVLCTVPNHELALQNIKNWLKPGGKLVILEHIHAEKKFLQKFQNIINPIWNIVAEGCHLNRNTDIVLKELGMTLEFEAYFTMGLRWYQAVFRK